ncbi:MAG TPA: hypothetical protein VI479_02640 [Blastocatellia bacterium]
MSLLLRCLIVVLILSYLCFAQESSNKTPPSSSAQKTETESQKPKLRPNLQSGNPTPALPPAFGPIQKIELSPKENSWAVQIMSRGGIIGTGRGDLTITSQGDLIWNGVENRCNAKLGDDVLQILTQTVFSASASGWGRTTSGFCADCYMFAIALQRREAGGIERTYFAYWDDAAAARIPADLRKVYDTFMSYKGCKQ